MERGLMWATEGPVAPDGARASDTGLRVRASELEGGYDELQARADPAAVRWRWAPATSGHRHVEPLRPQRLGRPPGRGPHRPPPPWQEHEAIGYDALGRVVCVREYDASGEVWLERFATWSRDAVEVACFRAPLEWGDEPLPAKLQAVLAIRLA